MSEDQSQARANLVIRFGPQPKPEPVSRRQRFQQDARRNQDHVELIEAWVREHQLQDHVIVIDAVPVAGMVLVRADEEGERLLRQSTIPAEILNMGQLDIELL